MEENLRLVDAVCELRDARIPASSRNPDIESLLGGKPRLVVLNRVDQADPKATALWRAYLKSEGLPVLETDCKSGRGVAGFPNALRGLLRDERRRLEAKGQAGRPLRAMVVGVPNVGKSSFINRAAGRRAAETSDRPGVTRGKQWIAAGPGIELLDTPGVLWPRFESPEVGLALAWTGAVKDDILDLEMVAARLMEKLLALYPGSLRDRYGLETGAVSDGYELLAAAARRRGYLVSGGDCDTERMARVLLDEFRGGKLGHITLERP